MATKSKRTVEDKALHILNLDSIGVDTSYQRDILSKHVNGIQKRYNPKALGIPLVAEREDGSLWVVDGLQRISALRAKGNKKVRAEVFASSGPEEEAEVFRIVNKNRVRPTALQMFHAALAATDESAWAIKEIAESHGFKIPKSLNPTHASNDIVSTSIIAVRSAEAIYKHGGKDALNFVLDVVKQIWPSDPLRVRDSILLGLFVFWQRHEKVVDVARLIPRLATTAPSKILYSAGLGMGGRSNNTADVIEKLYAKRSVNK